MKFPGLTKTELAHEFFAMQEIAEDAPSPAIRRMATSLMRSWALLISEHAMVSVEQTTTMEELFDIIKEILQDEALPRELIVESWAKIAQDYADERPLFSSVMQAAHQHWRMLSEARSRLLQQKEDDMQ